MTVSISQEITHCRKLLQISQPRMARLLNLKTTRLSDLEKARSMPSEAESARLHQILQQILAQSSAKTRTNSPLLADVRLRSLCHRVSGA